MSLPFAYTRYTCGYMPRFVFYGNVQIKDFSDGRDAAPEENIRELIRNRPLRDWPLKEELYNWSGESPS